MTDGLFAIIAYDRPGSDELRVEHRDGHIAHFRAHAGKIAVAGPMSGGISGSLVIFRAESESEARAFIQGDPFWAAGVWDRIEIAIFKAGTGGFA